MAINTALLGLRARKVKYTSLSGHDIEIPDEQWKGSHDEDRIRQLYQHISKQLLFFKKPYEIWLILSSVSAIILMTNVNLFVDNDNGTYAINNKVMFVGVTIGALLFIYGAQKVTSLRSLRALKAYLSDLQKGVLDQSGQLERAKRQYLWLWVVLFVLLSAFLIIGLLAAIK